MAIAIVAYGLGNVGSLKSTIDRVGFSSELVHKSDELVDFTHIILPGVGSFARASGILARYGWMTGIQEAVQGGAALLGICLGMQLLANSSSETSGEGTSARKVGLGLVPGSVGSLEAQGCRLRIPHIGWNSIEIIQDSILLRGVSDGADFYFVHSYSIILPNTAVVATTQYGFSVAAVVESGNVFGTQFHPEKSSVTGRRVLRNFCEYVPC